MLGSILVALIGLCGALLLGFATYNHYRKQELIAQLRESGDFTPQTVTISSRPSSVPTHVKGEYYKYSRMSQNPPYIIESISCQSMPLEEALKAIKEIAKDNK